MWHSCGAGALKVFGRKESSTSPIAGNSNYLSNHFADVRSASQAGRSQAATSGGAADAVRKTFQKQKELEKLLMKAENEDISMLLKSSLVKGVMCVLLTYGQCVYSVCFVFCWCIFCCLFCVVSTSTGDCLERLVSKMRLFCVERDVKLYSFTHSV